MARNPLRTDPTRTGLIRRAFVADMRKRFAIIKTAAWRKAVGEESSGGLGLNAEPVTNAPKRKRKPFQFETDDVKLKRFNKWLQDQINQHILEVHPTTGEPKGMKPWLYKYIDSAYRQGAVKAYTEVRKPDILKPQAFYAGSKAEFLQSSFAGPEAVAKLRLLYTRTYEDLKGITGTMASQLSRTLADGMANGQGAQKIARNISKVVTGIAKKRALVLARTEIIHAHAEGQLDSFEELGVEEVGADVEFSTSDDGGVCPICEELEGRVYTVAAARGVIPVHPNCRCGWGMVLRPRKKGRKVIRNSSRVGVCSGWSAPGWWVQYKTSRRVGW